MKKQLQQLAAFIILAIGVAAWVLLTGAMANDLISPGTYLICMAAVGMILWPDALWVSKHFIDGEWI